MGVFIEYSDALLWLALCTVVGLIADQLLFRLLRARARTRGLKALENVAQGLHWAPTAAGALIGATVATHRIGLDATTLRRVDITIHAFAILVTTIVAARVAGRVIRALTARDDVPLPSSSIFVNLARGTIWTIGAISILATFGVAVSPLLTALGVGGLAVGLALQPTLENAFSGIQLITSKQIQPGDYIRLGTGDEGTVLDITWRTTTIRKPSNEAVIVPNSVLSRAAVTNFTSLDPEYVLTVAVPFSVTGDTKAEVDAALEIARDVIARCPEAVPGQEPTARFAALANGTATLNLCVRCRSYQQRVPVRHELVVALTRRFAQSGDLAPGTPARPSADDAGS